MGGERLFIDYVNVLFSSNSQHEVGKDGARTVVYRLCQCSLFKQFTTDWLAFSVHLWLFIDYVNVLFSSNSQLTSISTSERFGCLSIMSMFSFQAIHNGSRRSMGGKPVVYRLCQCSLFKQFTTIFKKMKKKKSCLSIMSMFSFQAIHNSVLCHNIETVVVYRLCQCSLFKQFTTPAL